jgi:hypothetical protein
MRRKPVLFCIAVGLCMIAVDVLSVGAGFVGIGILLLIGELKT